MFAQEQKVQESWSPVYEAEFLNWSSVYSRFCKNSEGMDLQAGQEQASSFHILHRLPAEGVAQVKGDFSHLKRSGLKVYLLSSQVFLRKKKNPLQVWLKLDVRYLFC